VHLIRAFNEKRSERTVIANSSSGNKKQGLTVQSVNLSRNRSVSLLFCLKLIVSAVYDRNLKKFSSSTNAEKGKLPESKKNPVQEKEQNSDPPVIKNPFGHGQVSITYFDASCPISRIGCSIGSGSTRSVRREFVTLWQGQQLESVYLYELMLVIFAAI
jgi:hypothetical protein